MRLGYCPHGYCWFGPEGDDMRRSDLEDKMVWVPVAVFVLSVIEVVALFVKHW
jgi:hypothetical protein